MLGFGLCNMGQKIGKNSKPETDYHFYVEGLEKKILIWNIWLITIKSYVTRLCK